MGGADWCRPHLLFRGMLVSISVLFVTSSTNQFAIAHQEMTPVAVLKSPSIIIAKAKSNSGREDDVNSDSDSIDSDNLKDSSSSDSSARQGETENRPRQFKRQLIDTSIEEKAAIQTAPSGGENKSPAYLEREAKLSAPLKKLIQAPQIYDNSKGGSSEFAEAFLAATKDGEKFREDLLFIVENGSPAGKIYAAVLIKSFDAPLGNKILNGFKTDKTLVKNKSYTSLEHFTMGEVVTDLLSPAPTIILKPR